MQKRILYIWSLALVTLALSFLPSCTQEEVVSQNNGSCVQIIPRIPNYDDYYVSTRSGKSNEESAKKSMMMLVFADDGKLISKQSSTANIIVIDRTELKKEADDNSTTIQNASIYLLANITDSQVNGLGSITTLNDLKGVMYTTSTTSVELPATGLPMVGSKSGLDLTPNGTLPQKVEIPLELLYAKIEFNIAFKPIQVHPEDANKTKLYISSCVVHNLPRGVKLVDNVTDGQSAYYKDVVADETQGKGINITKFVGNRELTNLGELNFSFYMPEHMVNPGIDTYAYPANISDDEKQRYKNCWVEGIDDYTGKPVYITIKGIYSDHQEQVHEVTYKLYLGENAVDNFQVKRNGHYYNEVVIKGITNSKDAVDGSVSMDHRVTVNRGDFIIFMERETLLDCHFEVRPIRVKINPDANGNPKGKVKVSIADDCDWIRLEKKTSAQSTDATYCTSGKRKYFPTAFFESSVTANKSCEVTSNADNCVWIYIDENVETLDETAFYAANESQRAEILKERRKKTRTAIVTLTYTPADGSASTVIEYTFAQRYLYPVVSNKRTNADGNFYIYYIECYEEYLHNFDSDDGYGLTEYEGMEWGLYNKETAVGLQISDTCRAAFIDPDQNSDVLNGLKNFNIDVDGIINNSIASLSPQYDFYLTRDKEDKGLTNDVVLRDYEGQSFTYEIMEEAREASMVSEGTLEVKPLSAAEYCYNKNIRRSDSFLQKTDMHWYLPAIDEMEDIAWNAYFEVPEFQEKYYWSSQPSYEYSDFEVDVQINIFGWRTIGTAKGTYYNDDKNRARATKVEYGATEPTKSGLTKPLGTQFYQYRVLNTTTDNGYTPNTYSDNIIEEGNKLRTDMCRVRAVYMP